jgi:hypothetical protein
MREFTSICCNSKLLPIVNDERSQLQYVTVSAKEGHKTGTFNSRVFHTSSTVDFGFADISELEPVPNYQTGPVQKMFQTGKNWPAFPGHLPLVKESDSKKHSSSYFLLVSIIVIT